MVLIVPETHHKSCYCKDQVYMINVHLTEDTVVSIECPAAYDYVGNASTGEAETPHVTVTFEHCPKPLLSSKIV